MDAVVDMEMVMARVGADRSISSDVRDLLAALWRDRCSLIEKNRQLEERLSALEGAKMDCSRRESQPSVAVSHTLVHRSDSVISDSQSARRAFFSSSDKDVESEVERRRSLILRGVPEQKALHIRNRIMYDYQSVINVLHFLNVDCLPLAVYRLGKPRAGYNRLLKIVLPCSRFQKMVLQRSPRLRPFPGEGTVLARVPSLCRKSASCGAF
ncbi:hypothetical protein Q1695_012233 [Nippostrongylus brasiliensis]|nr:hypothetical protein Q1695_012233 [Nippostrongylus brasiliensis]